MIFKIVSWSLVLFCWFSWFFGVFGWLHLVVYSFYARMTMTNHWSINIYLVKIVTYDAREKNKNRLKKNFSSIRTTIFEKIVFEQK